MVNKHIMDDASFGYRYTAYVRSEFGSSCNHFMSRLHPEMLIEPRTADFILARMLSVGCISKEISSGVTVRGEGEDGVAGEGRVISETKFRSGKCTTTLTNVHCFLWPVTMRGEGEGSVAGEKRVVGNLKFHSWGQCTMALTNIHSDFFFITVLHDARIQ